MRAYLPEPARQRRLLIANQRIQITPGKVRLLASPGRGPSTGSDHCSFFPRDRESGGDLDELTDTDRENTRQLYELIVEVVREIGGGLQVIALDHADFEDDWFAASVIERWRDRAALIPPDWLQASEPAGETSDTVS